MTQHRPGIWLSLGVLSCTPFTLYAQWLAGRFPGDTALIALPLPIWLTGLLLLALPVWTSRRLKLLPAGCPPAS